MILVEIVSKMITIIMYRTHLTDTFGTILTSGMVPIKSSGNTFFKKDSFSSLEVNTFSHKLENKTEDKIPASIRTGNPKRPNNKDANPTLEMPSNTLVTECNSFLNKVVTSTILFGSTDAWRMKLIHSNILIVSPR